MIVVKYPAPPPKLGYLEVEVEYAPNKSVKHYLKEVGDELIAMHLAARIQLENERTHSKLRLS